MTVNNWNTFIVGKYRQKILKMKKRILRELDIEEDKFDEALEFAKDLFDLVSSALELSGKMPKTISAPIAAYTIINLLIKYVKKEKEKQDVYIRNIIASKKDTDTLLILLYRRDFAYNTKYYQRGVNWVCETGWHLQKIEEMY